MRKDKRRANLIITLFIFLWWFYFNCIRLQKGYTISAQINFHLWKNLFKVVPVRFCHTGLIEINGLKIFSSFNYITPLAVTSGPKSYLKEKNFMQQLLVFKVTIIRNKGSCKRLKES